MRTLTPVSYTHLDVYKRQDLTSCYTSPDIVARNIIYLILFLSLIQKTANFKNNISLPSGKLTNQNIKYRYIFHEMDETLLLNEEYYSFKKIMY